MITKLLKEKQEELRKKLQKNLDLFTQLQEQIKIVRVSINQMEGGLRVYKELIESEKGE